MATERLTIEIRGMTCASCVSRIERALRAQEGVIAASVNYAAQEATLLYDPGLIGARKLAHVIARLGYATPTFPDRPVKDEPPVQPQAGAIERRSRVEAMAWPVAAGLLGSVALVGLYLGIVSLAQDWQHATALIWDDRWLVGAIALGFGTQIGLYAHLRRLVQRHHQLGQCAALTAAGTGSSSVAMVACCLHHLAEVLPILGLTAAATLLNQYRVPFMIAGIGTNLAGIAVMLRLIRAMTLQPQLGSARSRPAAPLEART